MLFQFLLTKFSKSKLIILCLQKVNRVTDYCKRPIEKPISLERSVENFIICF